ncbi:MAG: hypothetical protein Q4G02_03765 [bacterium]|nr:hypothetical protein [bacterium]
MPKKKGKIEGKLPSGQITPDDVRVFELKLIDEYAKNLDLTIDNNDLANGLTSIADQMQIAKDCNDKKRFHQLGQLFSLVKRNYICPGLEIIEGGYFEGMRSDQTDTYEKIENNPEQFVIDNHRSKIKMKDPLIFDSVDRTPPSVRYLNVHLHSIIDEAQMPEAIKQWSNKSDQLLREYHPSQESPDQET